MDTVFIVLGLKNNEEVFRKFCSVESETALNSWLDEFDFQRIFGAVWIRKKEGYFKLPDFTSPLCDEIRVEVPKTIIQLNSVKIISKIEKPQNF